MSTQIKNLGYVALPPFSGIRVMMMPFRLEDTSTIPFMQWREPVLEMAGRAGVFQGVGLQGVGYLTIDEALIKAGETHRRPGLHVDGCGSWGGSSPWASRGMVLVSSHVGCVGWNQPLPGEPTEEGNCEHLRTLLDDAARIKMQPQLAYWCSGMAVHESIVQPVDVHRQLVRLSMPNEDDWYEGYTPSPYGVRPSGKIVKGRSDFMAYRV
jgi:hypothetical protein